MTKKLLAALLGTAFAIAALSPMTVSADDKKEDKKEQTTKDEKK